VIASVEGVVGAVAADSLVIEVGGIGYRVFAAPSVLATAQPGGRLKLHTYHLVREDQQALYGFRSTEELGFFTLLLTVNGVGPKVALAIVGSRPTADLQLAIMASDQAVLVLRAVLAARRVTSAAARNGLACVEVASSVRRAPRRPATSGAAVRADTRSMGSPLAI